MARPRSKTTIGKIRLTHDASFSPASSFACFIRLKETAPSTWRLRVGTIGDEGMFESVAAEMEREFVVEDRESFIIELAKFLAIGERLGPQRELYVAVQDRECISYRNIFVNGCKGLSQFEEELLLLCWTRFDEEEISSALILVENEKLPAKVIFDRYGALNHPVVLRYMRMSVSKTQQEAIEQAVRKAQAAFDRRVAEVDLFTETELWKCGVYAHKAPIGPALLAVLASFFNRYPSGHVSGSSEASFLASLLQGRGPEVMKWLGNSDDVLMLKIHSLLKKIAKQPPSGSRHWMRGLLDWPLSKVKEELNQVDDE